jgi:hypothetical protein
MIRLIFNNRLGQLLWLVTPAYLSCMCTVSRVVCEKHTTFVKVTVKKHSAFPTRDGLQREPRMYPYLDEHLFGLELIVHSDSLCRSHQTV